jgi:NAD+ synthase (glutamine-hydrolysing)
MSVQILKALDQGNEQVKADVQRIAGVYEAEGWLPKSPQELTSHLL